MTSGGLKVSFCLCILDQVIDIDFCLDAKIVHEHDLTILIQQFSIDSLQEFLELHGHCFGPSLVGT